MTATAEIARSESLEARPSRVTVVTLLEFLFGNRAAIERIARCPRAVWLGLFFVLSAGFAREYDGADLLHEPWHALVPIAASLGTSLLLFGLVTIVAKSRSGHSPVWPTYRQFLGLYWMTAPLAWLYAIPVERFMTPGEATQTNLYLLGLVSLWRVALMTRIVSVVWNCRWIASFFVVMLFADAVVTTIACFTPMPIINIMGGIPLTESEQIIQGVLMLVRTLGVVTLLLWFGGTVFIARHHERGTSTWRLMDLSSERPPKLSSGLWVLAAAALAVWIPILPRTQPEKIRERTVEIQLRRGPVTETIAMLSRYERDDFPRHWNPPPHFGYADHQPPLLDMLSILAAPDLDPEIRKIFADKLFQKTYSEPPTRGFHNAYHYRLENATDEELARLVQLLNSIPEGPAIAAAFHHEFENFLSEDDSLRGGRPRPELSAHRRSLIESLRNLATPEPEPGQPRRRDQS